MHPVEVVCAVHCGQPGYPDVGDIVVNSVCEPGTERVAAFEELIGCHGGAGGAQTVPFLLYPSEWASRWHSSLAPSNCTGS